MDEQEFSPMKLMSDGLKDFINQRDGNIDKQTKRLVRNIYHVVLNKKEED